MITQKNARVVPEVSRKGILRYLVKFTIFGIMALNASERRNSEANVIRKTTL